VAFELQPRASSGDVGSAQLRASLLSPGVDCIPETPSPRCDMMASRALGGKPAREAAPATEDKDEDEIAAAQATDDEDVDAIAAAPATDDESEVEDLTAGRQAGNTRKRAHATECQTWQRNERARRTPGKGERLQSPSHFSRVRGQVPQPQAVAASARQPQGAHEQGSSDEELLAGGVRKGTKRAPSNHAERERSKAVEKETAKQRKAEERAAAKVRKEAEAEAAKSLKAQQLEQARMQKQAAQAALKLQKEQDKEEKRKTSGKCAHNNIFITVDDRADVQGSDAAMQAIMAALREKYPAQMRIQRQSVAGVITFQRFVFRDDDGDAVSSCTRREETAPQVIFYLSPAQLVELVSSRAFVSWATEAVGHFPTQCVPMLLVVGLHKHLRSLGASSRGVEKSVAEATSQVLVHLRMPCRCLHSIDEAVALMLRTTRAIAEEPYRAVPSVVDLYKDAKASAGRAQSFSSGIESLFLAIPGIGESCAKSIAREYPSLRALARKYKEVAENEGREGGVGEWAKASMNLLENIEFEGSSRSSRKLQRVGPKRSERVHLLFHSRDPATVISTLVL
jgi:hypothetical protein